MPRDRPGKIIAGRYELLEPAGEGGMALVWRALIRGAGRFSRPVAVKRIHAARGGDPSFIQLFEEEARVGAAIHHPNVIQISDFGVDDEGDYYLVMEWVEGIDLHKWVRSHPRKVVKTDWPTVSAIGVGVLRGLSAAHGRINDAGESAPVYHRDISPSNVLLSVNGAVKLTDFGLARAMDRCSMTRPNVIKGKLAYCAPELISGQRANDQSDLFAVGVVLWESLAQRRLFTGKNDLEVLLAVRKGDIPRLSEIRPDVPPALTRTIHRALAPDPTKRFASANEMANALALSLKNSDQPMDTSIIGQSVRNGMERLGEKPRNAPTISTPALDVESKDVRELSLEEVPTDLREPPSELGDAPTLIRTISDIEATSEAPATAQEKPQASGPSVRGLWSDSSEQD